MNEMPRKSSPLSRRLWVILPALLAAYPIGLALLWTGPRGRVWLRVLATVLFLPIFVLLVLFLLRPYWDFTGSMAFRGFRLDFDRGTARDRIVEEHRLRQRELPTVQSAVAAVRHAAAWTDFRGPQRDGVCEETGLNLEWTNHPPRELYRQPVGQGYSGFTVDQGRAYTLEQRRADEAVVCYDVMSGRELWKYQYPASFEESLGGDGPRSTPTINGGRLYVLGAVGHFHCLKAASGKVVWAKNVLKDFGETNLHWGLSGSPLIVDDNVIVNTSGNDGPGLLAYRQQTGELVWKSDAGVQCYSSLVLTTLAGRRQLLNLADAAINGIDPADGRVLWSYPWPTVGGPSCAQPLPVGADRVYLSSGYGKGAALLQIKPLADGKFAASPLWTTTRMKNKFASAVIQQGHIYGLDEAVLCCLELESGERTWKGGKYGHGSVLLAQGHLWVLGEQGELALVEADPKEYRETARIQVLDGRTWNNFCIVGGILLARNHKEMVALDLRALGR